MQVLCFESGLLIKVAGVGLAAGMSQQQFWMLDTVTTLYNRHLRDQVQGSESCYQASKAVWLNSSSAASAPSRDSS